ncbi:MAG: hypothetical protein F4124_11130 [Acidimicrobiia bacterium]|nr:hypothetical protein [Acidimicrobiia bacterium]MYB75046.1 hypothetical protein [Acidimicrobiia bacterium]MYH99969.1 hypothetical protein [Acidimicrobiia bacterium]
MSAPDQRVKHHPAPFLWLLPSPALVTVYAVFWSDFSDDWLSVGFVAAASFLATCFMGWRIHRQFKDQKAVPTHGT